MDSTRWLLDYYFVNPITKETGADRLPTEASSIWKALINNFWQPGSEIPFVDRSSRWSYKNLLPKDVRPSPGEEGMDISTRRTRLAQSIAAFEERFDTGKDVEDVLPYRSKSDRGLRQVRFPDLYRLMDRSIIPIIIEFDYIMALNLALLSVRDSKSFWTAYACGLMNYGIQTFLTNCGSLSTRLKFSNIIEKPQEYIGLIELENLTGYRNLPDPSFDFWRDAEGLANSGHDVTNFKWKLDILNGLFPVQQRELPDFRTWVKSLTWLTAGASSIGKMEVDLDGERVKFKARKNCVPFIFTLEEILELVEKQQQCDNDVVLKQELKKVRIAVASDLANYLIQSYMLEMIGDSYKQWPGNTLAESAADERIRLKHMMTSARARYGLPFDYAAFDHQPSRQEILAILSEIFKNVFKTPEQQKLYDKMIYNLKHEYLRGRFEGVEKIFTIKGGLMSGYRITSLIGNCWNAWMTTCASALTERTLGFKPEVSYIRGDDSALYFNDWWQAVVFRSMYAVVQADGNDKKFGVIWQKMEFLRTLITPDGCFAYPNRAAAAITQRKPWSGERWQPINIVSGLADAVDRTARRQWTDLTFLKDHLLKRYSQVSGIPYTLFYCPQQRGGAGLMPWGGYSRGGPFKAKLTPIVKSQWYEEHLLTAAPKLTQTLAADLAQQHASNLVTADDVPGVSRLLRQQARKDMRARKVQPLPKYKQFYWPNGFGPPPRLLVSREQQLYIEAGLMTWGDVVRLDPECATWLRRIEARGCPRWLARSFLEGDAPGTINIDPKFRGQLTSRVLSDVSFLYAKTNLEWLALYVSLFTAHGAVITSGDEYVYYGHL